MKPKMKLKIAIDELIFLGMLGSMISGILLSEYLFVNVHWQLSVSENALFLLDGYGISGWIYSGLYGSDGGVCGRGILSWKAFEERFKNWIKQCK